MQKRTRHFMMIASLVAAISISFTALAGPAEKSVENEWWCKTTPWPYSRDLGIGAIVGSLEQTDRLDALQMIWYEVVNRPAKTVAPPLIAYLSKTESNADLREFIKLHTFFAFEKFTTEPLIKKWPQRPDFAEQKTELKTLCENFRKAGGDRILEGRAPQSASTAGAPTAPEKKK